MKSNTQFKNEALDALRGNWVKAVVATLVYLLLTLLVAGPSTWQSMEMQSEMSGLLSRGSTSINQLSAMLQDPAYQLLYKRSQMASGALTLWQIFLILPLTLGYANALRRLLVHGDNAVTRNTFGIAFRGYWRKMAGMLQQMVLIILWSLLFLIPGIVKSFSYAMSKYILEEYPELSTTEAIHRSRMMMRGHKFDLFWLYLSFIGWGLLCIFTFGIGVLWLVPYMETAEAAFYEEVKRDYALNGGLD